MERSKILDATETRTPSSPYPVATPTVLPHVTVRTDDTGKIEDAHEILIGKFESKVTTSVILPNWKVNIKN
jgi:hypothetical protein